MSAPQLAQYQNGVNQVSGDQLNTFQQWCVNAAQLRTLTGLSNMMVYMQGFSTALDGGQGLFYWNAASTAADDGGLTTVVPNGSSSGAWNRIFFPDIQNYSYLVPVTSFSTTIPSYTNTLILNPASTLAAGTVIMPAALFDGQLLAITSSQTITALTLAAQAGQTIVGTATTITSTTPIKFIYRAANKTFYRY